MENRIDNLEVRFNNLERGFKDKVQQVGGGAWRIFWRWRRILTKHYSKKGTLQGTVATALKEILEDETNLGAEQQCVWWVKPCGEIFNLKGVLEQEGLQAVMVAMEGKTLSWFRWWRFCRSNPSWEDFKGAVISKFQPEFDLDIWVQEEGSESWEQNNKGKNAALKFKNQLGREEAIHKEVEQVKETNIKMVVAEKETETELELHAGPVVEVQEADVAARLKGKESGMLTEVHLEIHDELFHKFQIVAGSVLQAIRFLCKTFKQKLEAGLGEMFKGSWQQEGLREFSFDPGGIQQLLAIHLEDKVNV
ncbi:hypothetical protein SESBI_01170 [Sesbania bispinosa]|nr:hypothetical protein SESBI_01170 [Sesbania bispinosa]